MAGASLGAQGGAHGGRGQEGRLAEGADVDEEAAGGSAQERQPRGRQLHCTPWQLLLALDVKLEEVEEKLQELRGSGGGGRGLAGTRDKKEGLPDSDSDGQRALPPTAQSLPTPSVPAGSQKLTSAQVAADGATASAVEQPEALEEAAE